MADKKISQLSSATALAGTEVLPVVQSGATVKATVDQILSPAAGKGINFSANGGDTLTQYDEGTWTPVLVIGGGSVTYTIQTGTYTRIGRLVTISGRIKINTVSTPSSYVVINNMPNPPTGSDRGAASVWVNNLSALTPGVVQAQIRGSAGDIYFMTYSAGATGNLGDHLQANSELQFTATYEV